MMRIALFGRRIPEAAIPVIRELLASVGHRGYTCWMYRPFLESMASYISVPDGVQSFMTHDEIRGEVDFLFSIGGDGTILDSVSLVGDSGIPIAGINIGRLGFLSGISRDLIGPALDSLDTGDFLLEKRSLLQIESPGEIFGTVNFALNEISVYKPNVMSLLTIRAWINDSFLNAYWADGLIIATPTGSTAYSLSCNGPILTPETESFLITPIASHNLTVRPIVIRDDNRIRIKVISATGDFHVSLDSKIILAGCDTELVVSKAPFRINLLRLRNSDFFQTIREKLNWGLDNRN